MADGYTRREFLTNIGSVLRRRANSALTAPASSAPPKPTSLEWLRPPGALDEAAFLETCTRCTDCIEACPYDSIRRLGPEFGDAGGTPAIIIEQSPCYLCEDMPCIASCEPKALVALPREAVRMATADLKRSLCYQAQNQPCDYCVERCPIGQTAIAFGDDGVPAIDGEHCTGCGVCAYLCPADAIEMWPVVMAD